MLALNRKLLRDLWQMRGQALAIGAVMACGIATFVMSLSTLESLRITRDTYFDRYRFAHVFAPLKRAPNALAERIEAIPGVAKAQTRIAHDVTLDIPGLREPAVGRLLSIPDRPSPGLNEVHLRRGRYIEPQRRGEAIVSEAFADAHHLNPGDAVTAIINGKKQKLSIVGVGLSPEYVFQIRAGDLLPDDKRFGVFWMGRTELAAAFNMEGAFNDVTLTLMRGASEEEVIRRLDLLTAPYGGVGAFGRNDQVSARYLADEIKQLRATGLIAPSIFLSVAAFLMNVVITRLISTQREQIAALKAFGYTKPEIGWHYLKLVLLIGVAGFVVGVIVGLWLGHGMTQMYTQFYKFPVFFFRFQPSVIATGFLLSLGASSLGAISAVLRAVSLPPAEAMRPEPPADFRPTLVERIGLQRLFAQTARMVLRQLERKPVKALLSIVGIAIAGSVLVLGQFSRDAIDYLIEFQFSVAQRQTMSVTFVESSSVGVLHEVEHLPGVLHSEGFRSVPARLRLGHRHRRVGIMAIPTDATLYRVMDIHERHVQPPPQGLLLSRKLAELLGAKPGDTITIEVMEGRRPVRNLPVAATVDDMAGTNAYMTPAALHAMMEEGECFSGAFLDVDGGKIDELYDTIKQTPKISSVSIQEAAVQSFRESIAENIQKMQTFNVIFAVIIAFGVVYNTARISLSERSRELATLRVIGFTRGEISAILLGELGILTLAAIPLGLAIGYGFAAFTCWALETEMFRIPLVVTRWTFGFSAVVITIAATASGLIVRRRLDHLDLVAVLKSRE